MKRRDIYISAGHSNFLSKDRGAVGNGFIEGELAVEFRNLVIAELRKLGAKVITDPDSNVLRETLAFFRNKTTNDCIVLDIHWNSATPRATGTETLIPSQNTTFERTLAQKLSETVSDTLGIPLRGTNGVKTELESHHGSLGWMRLTGENVLMEVCFISNAADMKKYQTNKNLLAQRIAKVLFDFSETGLQKTYTVVKGDTLAKIAKNNNTTVEKIKSDNKLLTDTIRVGQVLKI